MGYLGLAFFVVLGLESQEFGFFFLDVLLVLAFNVVWGVFRRGGYR